MRDCGVGPKSQNLDIYGDGMRPCNCGNAQKGPFTPDQCRHCWHSLNTPFFRKLWGIDVVLNVAEAVVKHAADGMALVDEKTLCHRLAICETCEEQNGSGNCGVCGCIISLKATWRSESCPLLKWPGDVEKNQKRCACKQERLSSNATPAQ